MLQAKIPSRLSDKRLFSLTMGGELKSFIFLVNCNTLSLVTDICCIAAMLRYLFLVVTTRFLYMWLPHFELTCNKWIVDNGLFGLWYGNNHQPMSMKYFMPLSH